ncbi:hypothetical protein TNCV_1952501 [Trichonephila clavipes]|nr:hypothetical protein TNCV_1952501 [Trichonephila clavipes]
MLVDDKQETGTNLGTMYGNKSYKSSIQREIETELFTLTPHNNYSSTVTVTTVTFSGHMAGEASLHPISEKYIGTTVGCILLACRKQLIGRANRWSNFLGRADF